MRLFDNNHAARAGWPQGMRLAALVILASAAVAARAQWEIFAEAPPAPGAWAKYDLKTEKSGGQTEHSQVSIAVTGAEKRAGEDLVWLQIYPTKWLGSKSRGTLKLLIPAHMTRQQASHLLSNTHEIVFKEDGRAAYAMTPKDISSVAGLAGLKQSATLTPDGKETVDIALGRFPCERSTFRGELVIDPPFVAKQTTTLAGSVCEDDKLPFRVVKLSWEEVTRKKDKNKTENKTMTLLAYGREGAVRRVPERGEPFSVWRVLIDR